MEIEFIKFIIYCFYLVVFKMGICILRIIFFLFFWGYFSIVFWFLFVSSFGLGFSGRFRIVLFN